MTEEGQTAIGRIILKSGEDQDTSNTEGSLLFALSKGARITIGRNAQGSVVSWLSPSVGQGSKGLSHLVSKGERWGGIPYPTDDWFALKYEEGGPTELSNRMDHLLYAIRDGWPVFIYTTPDGTGVITWERQSHGNNPAVTIDQGGEVSSWYDLPDSLRAGKTLAPEDQIDMLAVAMDKAGWEPTTNNSTPEMSESKGPEGSELPRETQQFIFTFEDRATRDEFLDLAEENGVPARWIALSPKEEYDNEREFAYEEMFDDLAWTVLRTIEEDLGNEVDESEDRSGAGEYAWPDLGFREWTQDDRRELVTLAVTRWNHLGPNGAEWQSILRDHKAGLIPHSQSAE